ncbi:MAG TPA: phospholipase D-like domain-containing protein [Steroidobacteraceae bacterium]|nr:phospholipase D-like domain-containing protein [Steroidobacteraceae bacterium]
MFHLTTTAPTALSVVHLLLAIGVTIHVLLYKRENNTSAAWIGLAWLAPILGSVLYLLLGINRVRRRAQSLRGPRPTSLLEEDGLTATGRDDHLALLESAVQRITHRSAEPGNTVAPMRNGDEAYPIMLAAIEAAERSIVLSSYIFRADAAGTEFIDALVRATRRGVEVRVLIDGIGAGYFVSPAYRRLRRARVPVARFMHSSLPWRMPFLNLRSHKKILGIDGRVAFAGGLNIGGENITRNHPRHPVIDTHFRFEGPVVAQLVDVFADDWSFTTGERLTGERWFPPLAPLAGGNSVGRAVTSGPDQDLEKIEFVILEAVACARSSVRIMTPYFLPDDRIVTGLALAAYRGVTVDVVLPEHSNHPTLDWASRAQIGPLLAAGCRVWTHPPPFDHSKLMTVDGLWSLVGSSNWDVRSFRLNFELDLEVYDSAVAEQVNQLITAQQGSRLLPAHLQERPLAVRLRDGAARLMLPYL